MGSVENVKESNVEEIASGINLQDAETEHIQEENIGQTSSVQSDATILEHDPKIKELKDKILHLNRKHEEDREEIRKLKVENDETKSKNEQLKTDLGILDNKVNILLTKFPSLE